MKFKLFFLFLIFINYSHAAYARTTLLEVFGEALKNDPTYQEVVAETKATEMGVDVSLAGLLPNLSLTAYPSLDKMLASGAITNQGFFPSSNLTRKFEMKLKLTQSIFDFAKWANLAGAEAKAKETCAKLNATLQDLMLRVSEAYFNILQDEDQIAHCEAHKKSLAHLYLQAKQNFKTGSITRIELYSSQSAFSAISSECLTARTKLATDKTYLFTITNAYYLSLANLKKNFPLVSPQPLEMQAWVIKATRQNWDIKAHQYALQNAKHKISEQFAGHLPLVEAEGYYSLVTQNPSKGGTLIAAGPSKIRDFVVGLKVNMPIFSGGQVSAATAQAQHNYEMVERRLEATIRKTIFNTRESYLNIIMNINKLKNDKIILRSAYSTLRGVKERYHIGDLNVNEVLNQHQKVLQAENEYAAHRYAYIINLIKLKYATGTLGIDDIQTINSWLKA